MVLNRAMATTLGMATRPRKAHLRRAGLAIWAAMAARELLPLVSRPAVANSPVMDSNPAMDKCPLLGQVAVWSRQN